jgi:uncharacterized protein
MINFTEKDGALIFAVRVIPRSSKSEIVGEYDGALKIKLNSPPVDGAANDELVKLLAKQFGVSRAQIEILSGQTSKSKQVKISGVKKSALPDTFSRPKR